MPSGLFVTLEGGEGSGKSTLQKALAKRFSDEGFSVVQTREPGGTPGAETLRELVLHPADGMGWSALSTAFLMSAARIDHLERVIRPALTRGDIVICDRFADSTFAYQGGGALDDDALERLIALSLGGTQPDLTLLLDGPPEAFLERRRAREVGGGEDRFEAADGEFHAGVRSRFLDLAMRHPDRIRVLDATQAADDVESAAWVAISQVLTDLVDR